MQSTSVTALSSVGGCDVYLARWTDRVGAIYVCSFVLLKLIVQLLTAVRSVEYLFDLAVQHDE